jgi:hypothetical protein
VFIALSEALRLFNNSLAQSAGSVSCPLVAFISRPVVFGITRTTGLAKKTAKCFSLNHYANFIAEFKY